MVAAQRTLLEGLDSLREVSVRTTTPTLVAASLERSQRLAVCLGDQTHPARVPLAAAFSEAARLPTQPEASAAVAASVQTTIIQEVVFSAITTQQSLHLAPAQRTLPLASAARLTPASDNRTLVEDSSVRTTRLALHLPLVVLRRQQTQAVDCSVTLAAHSARTTLRHRHLEDSSVVVALVRTTTRLSPQQVVSLEAGPQLPILAVVCSVAALPRQLQHLEVCLEARRPTTLEVDFLEAPSLRPQVEVSLVVAARRTQELRLEAACSATPVDRPASRTLYQACSAARTTSRSPEVSSAVPLRTTAPEAAFSVA